jgi:hypothetical protein
MLKSILIWNTQINPFSYYHIINFRRVLYWLRHAPVVAAAFLNPAAY